MFKLIIIAFSSMLMSCTEGITSQYFDLKTEIKVEEELENGRINPVQKFTTTIGVNHRINF